MTSTLKLTVVSYGGEPRQGMSKRFDASRATVGRGADNDWTLPDPEKHLSSRHCIIEKRDNRYVIIDVSRNGVFLNGAEYALGNGSFAVLADGDLILIGGYQLQAEIEADFKVCRRLLPRQVAASPGFRSSPITSALEIRSRFSIRRDLSRRLPATTRDFHRLPPSRGVLASRCRTWTRPLTRLRGYLPAGPIPTTSRR